MNTLSQEPYYLQIKETLNRLIDAGFLDRFAGNCVGATDLLQTLLNQAGISSRIVEVQLTLTRNNESGLPDYTFIGFDNLSFAGHLDTHLVIVTETKVPLLIDFSIAHALNKETIKYVIEPFEAQADTVDLVIERAKLSYQIKKTPRFPLLHQKTLLQRIKSEESMAQTLQWVKLLALIACGMGIINFTLNMILVVLKMLYL